MSAINGFFRVIQWHFVLRSSRPNAVLLYLAEYFQIGHVHDENLPMEKLEHGCVCQEKNIT